jgi:UDP-N-acetylmuramate--alanine ligase
VAEADEFDRSFLRLTPVSRGDHQIDRDHLDTYGTSRRSSDAFVDFASRVPFFGRLIVCLTIPTSSDLLPRLADRRVLTYGFVGPGRPGRPWTLEDRCRGEPLRVRQTPARRARAIDLPCPASTTCATRWPRSASGWPSASPFETIARALAGFEGVHRRFERLGTWRGAALVDDYAHHPTEVAATLQARGRPTRGGRVHAVFQPHLYSRTRTISRGASAGPCWPPTAWW